MSGMYTIRNLDEKTKKAIHNYAQEHGMNIGEAVSDLVRLAKEHLAHTEKKRYKSIFDVYDKVRFKAGKDLSERIDEVAYR